MAEPAPRSVVCPIHLRSGALYDLGDLLRVHRVTGVAIVTDTNVGPLYSARVIAGLERAGLPCTVVELPPGEGTKSLDTVRELYGRFLAARLERDGAVVALGGGVVGDTAGFAAATYLRGVGLVQAPTTLLAMVDSSIGGKVGVDLPEGKNLAGALVQPLFIAAEPETLETLPAQEAANGAAEIVKAAIIGNPDLFVDLERGTEPTALEVIWRAQEVKQQIVARDPMERGERRVLNLGHTFAHAFERLSGYTVPHGQAVAQGLVMAARLGARLQVTAPELPERIARLLRSLALPAAGTYDPDAVLQAMETDKKRRAGRLRFVIPRVLGDVVVLDDVPREAVRAVLAEPA